MLALLIFIIFGTMLCAFICFLCRIAFSPNHPYNVERRKQRWLNSHPRAQHKCPYK